MTEGILDKVFETFKDKVMNKAQLDFMTITDLAELKQELKAEIEKTFADYFNVDYYNKAVRLELIGNGEEKE